MQFSACKITGGYEERCFKSGGSLRRRSRPVSKTKSQLPASSAVAGFPTRRLIQIESKTGIPRHELAPELFEGYQRVAPLPVPTEEEKK